MLGPKTGFYRSLADELWGPVSKRTSVKQAYFWMSAGFALVIAGLVGVWFVGEGLNALVFGLLAMAAGWGTWKEHRGLWRAWRSIGDVALVGPPTQIMPGSVAEVTLRIVPRHAGRIARATLTYSCRDSRSGPAGTAWEVDMPIADPMLTAGVPCELVAEVVLPPGVPTSRFETGWTRQWFCASSLRLDDGREWERDYPVFVLPGAYSGNVVTA